QFLDCLVGGLQLAVASVSEDLQAEVQFEPLGFSDDEALLPDGPLQFSGFRLLQEMLAFPQKFLFFRVHGLSAICRQANQQSLSIHLGLSESGGDLFFSLNPQAFSLNCSPVINLFEHRCDRVRIQNEARTHLLPDRVHPQDYEIHSVLSVKGFLSTGKSSGVIPPLFGAGNANEPSQLGYVVEREITVESEQRKLQGGRSRYLGSETYLSIQSGSNADNQDFPVDQISVLAYCSNRDLPLILPFGKGDEDFEPVAVAPGSTVQMLRGPSRPVSKIMAGRQVWELIHFCSLNTLSMTDSDQLASRLRLLLSLLSDPTNPNEQQVVQSILKVSCKPQISPFFSNRRTVHLRGLSVELELDPEQSAGIGFSIPGGVWAHFLSRYASVNSFVQTRATAVLSHYDHTWPPMAGTRAIL
ncbi:MAG: type VI secretion system baseplate subunit TssF, partial [Limnobacter sp.]|nr:type VI secretion system baseplate subunit TssF [Limnobacter sp.]